MFLREQQKLTGEQRRYGYSSGRLVRRSANVRPSRLSWTSLTSLLSTMLLPKGFPDSVCPEYVRFQLWDTSQEACGYFKSILTSKAWLTGLGVGDSGSDVVSALTYTMVIAYSGMVCGLLCATPRLVARFAVDMKRWRMVAELLGLLGSLFTILAGAYPQHFLPLSCAAGAIGALSNVAGGVSRAPLISHLARAHNEADVSAKEGSQSRLLKLVAIAAGYRFLLYVDAEAHRAAAAFVALVVLKIAFQLCATRLLELRTLNKQRLCLLLRAFRRRPRSAAASGAGAAGLENKSRGMGMSPAAVAAEERIFRWQQSPGERLHIGVSLSKVANLEHLEAASFECGFVKQGRRYSVHPAAGAGSDRGHVAVLAADAGPHDQLRAFMYLDAMLAMSDRGTSTRVPAATALHASTAAEERNNLYAKVERDFPRFLEALEYNGWETEHLLLGDDEWRVEINRVDDDGNASSRQRTKAE